MGQRIDVFLLPKKIYVCVWAASELPLGNLHHRYYWLIYVAPKAQGRVWSIQKQRLTKQTACTLCKYIWTEESYTEFHFLRKFALRMRLSLTNYPQVNTIEKERSSWRKMPPNLPETKLYMVFKFFAVWPFGKSCLILVFIFGTFR